MEISGGTPESSPAQQPPRRSRVAPPPRVRIVDVANAAGVSQATASKALNGSSEINEATRAHVVATARRLGYRPNIMARSLKGWRSQSIGVVTDDRDGFFSTSMMRGIEAVASERGSNVFLCNTLGDVSLERHHLLALLDKQVDGLILLSAEVRARGGPVVDLHGVPIIYLYCYADPPRIPSVIPDDRGGARGVTEYLISQGYRAIVMLNGPASFEASRLRLEGYREALASAGIPFDPNLVRDSNTWFQRAGYQMLRDIMAEGIRFDSVFGASDHLASGALSALQEAGIKVPDDIALIGFDDRPFASELPVPLTTMALPQEQMGRRAAELLFRAIDGEQLPVELHHIDPILIERNSVRPRT